MKLIFIVIMILLVLGIMKHSHKKKPRDVPQWDRQINRGQYADNDEVRDDNDDVRDDDEVLDDDDGLSVVSADSLVTDKNSELLIVSETTFEVRPVMGKQEAHIFYKIENWVKDRDRGERVFVQISMGAFLIIPKPVYRFIGCKRPDYVIVDRRGVPICVVEYLGRGHFQGDALERDQIKKAALANAKIPLVEIFEHERNNDNIVCNKLNAAVKEKV